MAKRIYIVQTEDQFGWLTPFTMDDVRKWDDETFIQEAENQGFVWEDMESFMESWNNWDAPEMHLSVMRILNV